MRNTLSLLCMACTFHVYSQTYPIEKGKLYFPFKEEYPSIITSFLAGAMEGTSETLKWHYTDFEEFFPEANKNFWNPKYSWRNKYKNRRKEDGPRFPGSNTYLVWTTDGYHAVRFARNVMLTTTLALHPLHKKRKWYNYALDIAVHTLAYQVGFHATYTAAFR